MEERQQRLDISVDRVLQELARIAFFDPRKLFNHDGSLKDITELDADTAAAIASVEIDMGQKSLRNRRKCCSGSRRVN
jgi:phage terminase small subunit